MNQYETIVVNHQKQGPKTLKIGKSQLGEAEEIMLLQNHVLAGIGDANLFALTPIEQVEESLLEDYCISITDEEGLVGFGLLVVNRDTPRQALYHLKNGAEKKGKSATVDSIFIHERARGYGLQKKIFEKFMVWARDQNILYLHTTISPLNQYSLQNALNMGFEVADTKELYGGKLRHILEWKNLD